MSDQDPRSRPAPARRPTVRDALEAADQAGRHTHERLQAALLPVLEQGRAAHALLTGIAAVTDELLGTGTAAAPRVRPAIADPPAPAVDGGDRERVGKALLASDSENTRRAYRSQWARFERFCAGRGEQALPAHPAMVAIYLTRRSEDGVGIATLRQAAAAIKWVHEDCEMENPCAGAGVRKVLAGLAREHGTAAGQARGLTEEGLAAIRASAHRSRRGKRGRLEKEAAAIRRGDFDIALIGLMRDGLLRRSEAAAVRWGDLSWAADGSGRLLLRYSKTDQEGLGHIAYAAPATMVDLDRIRPPGAGPEERIFGISGSQISRRINAAARAAGLGPGYSGHSPRVGMTMDLAAMGASMVELLQAGRWRSAAMPSYYARNQLADHGAVAKFHRRDGAAKTAAAAGEPLRPDFGAGRPFDEPPPADFPVFGP